MAKTGITLDQSTFNRAFQQYLKLNKRENSELINAKAIQISHEALKRTPVVKKSKIFRELGVRFRKGSLFIKKGALIYGLIHSRQRRAGKKLLVGREFMEQAERLVMSRGRGAGFIKAGWVFAIRKLDKATPKAGRPGSAKRQPKADARGPVHLSGRKKGQPKGGAKPAVASLGKVEARIFNNIPGAEKAGAAALAAGFRFAAADIAKYIARKKQKTADRFAA
jgi:hypothetical protein